MITFVFGKLQRFAVVVIVVVAVVVVDGVVAHATDSVTCRLLSAG